MQPRAHADGNVHIAETAGCIPGVDEHPHTEHVGKEVLVFDTGHGQGRSADHGIALLQPQPQVAIAPYGSSAARAEPEIAGDAHTVACPHLADLTTHRDQVAIAYRPPVL